MKYELKDICKTNQSSYSKSDKWTFINYLDTGNITKNKIDEIQCINLENEKLPSRAKRKVEIDDIIYSTVRPNQLHYGIIKQIPDNFLVSTGFTTIKVNKKIAEPKFIFYYITQDEITEHLSAIAEQSTSAYPSIKPSDIENLEIDLPSLEIQKQIASILTALDDKIELNNRINENLELQAQAIFKSWFVDFEPFGGVMPENWKIGSLSDIADVLSGKRPPMKQNNKTEDVDIPLVGAAAIMGYTNKFNHDDKILVIGRVGTHGIVQRFDYPCWTSDNTLVIKSNCYEYIYQILKLIDYKAINRGSTQPLITQGDLKKTEIIIPSKECLQKYEDVVGSLMYRYSQNRIENEKLALLRDTLLPKLMNGEIDVSKVKI